MTEPTPLPAKSKLRLVKSEPAPEPKPHLQPFVFTPISVMNAFASAKGTMDGLRATFAHQSTTPAKRLEAPERVRQVIADLERVLEGLS